MKVKKYTLSIGLNDKTALKQIIKTDNAISIIKNIIARQGFGGFSVFGGIGFYTNEQGIDTTEKTLKVEILDFGNKGIDEIKNCINIIGKLLNQESIALQQEIINSDLIFIK